MPCPVRWMKCSARPAPASTSRAARSISSHVTPGRTASTDAAWAAWSAAYVVATSGSRGVPTAYVRVLSEPQPVQGRCHVGHGDATGRYSPECERIRVLAVDPGAHLDPEVTERHVPEPGVLERGRDEDGRHRGVARHHERGESLERRAGDA